MIGIGDIQWIYPLYLRRAVECVEAQYQKQSLQTKDFSANNKVTVASIASVCNEVYGSKVASPTGSKIGFPLQQKIVICSLMVLFKDKKIKEVSRSKVSVQSIKPFWFYNPVCSK